MPIQRLHNLSPDRFVADFMRANRPVVVTDALAAWRIDKWWTPHYLLREFGEEKVQIYNSYFELKSVRTLGQYLRERFNRPDARSNPRYVRWYTKLRDVDFSWADCAFEAFRSHWSRPYFLPVSDYVFPFAPAPRRLDPAIDHFPARGLFISERGARTGLHVDPWASDAVLCQLYGRKRWRLYAPDQAGLLQCGTDVVDIDTPDLTLFPRAAQAQPTLEFTLDPGEALYVPHDWYHVVHSESDSISMTWNFVHRVNVDAFSHWLEAPRSKIDDEILRFFFSKSLGSQPVTSPAIKRLIASAFAG